MERASAIGISLLLILSILAPYGAMAQETPTPTPAPEPTGSCGLGSSLEVVNLDYTQATAIQGIVMQDVATSAESYRKQAALADLGVDTRTEQQKIADQYNFYFMGPDGIVYYYQVLGDLMKPDNGYLIGTELTGRIEYGGKLRENVAMCGKSPTNATGNVCVGKGNIDKVTEYVDSMKAAKTKADILSFVSSFAPVDALAPEDIINLGQSRLRMTSFTTSMATSGPGSAVFVLPQALVLYTAAMKKLDMIDLAITVVALGSVFSGHAKLSKDLSAESKTFWKRLTGGGGKLDTFLEKKTGTQIASSLDEYATTLDNQLKGVQKARLNWIQASTSGDQASLKSAEDLLFKEQLGVESTLKEMQRGVKVLADSGDESSKVLNAQISEWRAMLKVRPSGQGSLESLTALDEVLDLGKEVKASKAYISIPEELAGKIMGPSGVPLKKGEVVWVKDLTTYAGQDGKIYSNYKLVSTGEAFTVESLAGANIATKSVEFEKAAYYMGQANTLGVSSKVSPFTKAFGLSAMGEGSGLSNALGKVGGDWGALRTTLSGALPKAAEGVAFHSLISFGRAMYFGPGTKVLLFARGLHAVNDLFFRQGFFELTGAGLSLRYSKDEIGTIFADDSVIVLLAKNTQIDGLMTAYLGGELGSLFFGLLGGVSKTVEPLVSKANTLGDVLLFGGIMYPPKGGVIEVVAENPTGTTHIEQSGSFYIMHIREWDDHVFTAVEDVRTMEAKGSSGQLVTAMGMWISKVDLYGHMFSENPDDLKGVFTSLDQITKQMGNWGVFSNLLVASSAYYMFMSPLGASLGGLAFGVAGLPLGMTLVAKNSLLAGKEFQTAKYTSMKDLAACVSGGNATLNNMSVGEGGLLNAQFSCERPVCAEALNDCFAREGAGSAAMGATAIASYAVTGPLAAVALMPIDMIASIYKVKVREECLAALATCQESTFTVLGAAQYSDPAVIAEQQQSDQLKSLPGLEALPINDFLSASGLGNVTNPLEEFSQQQLNVHTEGYNASGRIAFDQVYYAHLQDISIQWLEGNLPINLCSLDDAGDPEEAQCLSILGNDMKVGGRTIVSSELVPFKWMDTELPALVIPNTAVVVKQPAPSCALFTADKTGTRITLNSDVVKKFEAEGFDEVARTLGTLRVINTDSGSIYPSVDYNGDFRLEHDKPDGSFGYSEADVTVTGDAKVLFGDTSLGFESAVFTGGSIIKKGDKIYVLPKYFMPTMGGKQWLEATKGAPLKSDTGEQLEARDAAGNIIGIDATKTRIPGAEKLGTLTRLDAEKDTNGDGKITDDEKAGWRFYTDENNQSKFDLWYNGQKETYDASQVEIDEATGNIKVYEAGQEHTDANLMRDIETKVDSLGRTLLTIRDGQGNTLLEEALVTYLKGTGGAIRYDPDNNNYIFVNGQPVELNNDFKLNGFNPITGSTDPPLLQPSSVKSDISAFTPTTPAVPSVPLHEDGLAALLYALAIFAGIYLIYRRET